MEFLIGIVIVFFILAFVIKTFSAISSEISNYQEPQPELPYKTKYYLFSRSEHEFLRILNQSIDRQRYLVFPKVRLADFIEVTVRGKEYQGWWNKIKSKHVDFLIWDVQNNKIALAIELDGSSHNSEKMQVRDEFVNKLYEKIGLKLERVKVGSDFLTEIKQVIELLRK